MTAHPYTFKIGGTTKGHKGNISIDWDVDTIDTFSCVLREAEELNGFDSMTIERDDVELFAGRIETPRIQFGSQGKPMPVDGFDWTARLKDFLTTSQSIVNSTTVAALTAILSETDFATSVVGTFEYITALQDWDATSHVMLTTIPTYTNTCIEYDPSDIEIDNEFADGRTIADFATPGLHTAFFYDGATERYYCFTREGNDIFYYHSTDGLAWTRVDSTVNSNSAAWSVAWHDSKVYLFVFDGANTDFWRGTINDGTGAISWTALFNPVGSIFGGGGTIRFGPVWDDGGHMWVVEASATGSAWESTDDGATWGVAAAPNFSAPANHTLWAVLPQGTDGDMYGFVVDVPNDDLEEWFWDRSGGTFTYVVKIETTSNDIDNLDGGSNADYRPQIAWTDSGKGWFAKRDDGGGWTTDLLQATTVLWTHISVDMGECAYVLRNSGWGTLISKYKDGVQISDTDYDARAWGPAGAIINCAAVHPYDEQVGIFGCGRDGDSDGWFFLYDPTGIRLNRGQTSGDFTTDTVNASGAMVSWGILTASGVGIENGADVLWDILKAADSSVLANDKTAAFDLDVEGVSAAETAIKIKGQLDDNGTDPYVYEFDITEKTDDVSLDTDYEDCYTGMMKLAVLAGAEVYVTYDGTTWTVVLTTSRGSDKTATVVLKTASTADEPDTRANVKVLEKIFDWSSYANAIFLTGGTDGDGNRITAEVRNNTEIASVGQEHWFRISDDEITTNAMARQRVYQELIKRNSVVLRITGEFVDKYDTTMIEIGDTVVLISEWNDGALKISGSHRIVKLHRSAGVDGEQVSAEFSNKMKTAQFWNYMKLTDDHGRWITA